MKIPEGYFIIHQPKYRVPCIFDLHSRGLFKTRPFVTKRFGFRVVANQGCEVKLQCGWLKEARIPDERSGRYWEYAVETRLLDLDKSLKPGPGKLVKAVEDKDIQIEINNSLAEWREGYLPQEGKTFAADLEKKILASVEDHKSLLRRQLVHKNHDWVMAGLPRRLQDFRFYLYPRVREGLIEAYKSLGGESDEARLIRHLVLFNVVFDHEQTDLFKALEGGSFKAEDQAWECWVGFVGSEDEARRLCSTMESVFRPLAQKMAA